MTLFTNPNFIDYLIKSQGADRLIDQEHYPSMQMLIEFETRLVLETAAKFMRRDRRDALSAEDVQLAARNLSHSEMMLPAYSAQYVHRNEQTLRMDPLFASPEAHFE